MATGGAAAGPLAGAVTGRMRVGVFSECYEPVQNGVTTSLRTLVDGLRHEGHRVFVVAPRYAGHADSDPFVLRLPSLHTWFSSKYPIAAPWVARLDREALRLAPSLVHSHNPFFVGLVAARYARDAGVPLVATYHTLYNHYGHYLKFVPDAVVQGLLRWWMPTYYNLCAQIIVPSRVAGDSLTGYGVQSPITVLPTAVPLPDPALLTPDARAAARARLGVPADAALLLYVGRAAREKNIELVLEAFARVAAGNPACHLVVVGAGPHLDALRQAAAHMAAAARVRIVGAIPHDDLPPIYACADLFVFSSVTETQGLVMAEARAAGTPCILVRGGGAGETIIHGEDGFVVDQDAVAFADAVTRVVGDPDLHNAMRAHCLRRALLHTPDAMTRRVIAVYEQALSGFRATPAAPNSPP
ncbi:MAG: glycosyltransferase [Armatimonadetes bacterium]|nr:glycosyltransferase [Armatimonadota bacterium]